MNEQGSGEVERGWGTGELGEMDGKPGVMTEGRESLSGLREKQKARGLRAGEAKAENGPQPAHTSTHPA